MTGSDSRRGYHYHRLMPFKVQHILLVASAYDSFILEEDGLFSEQLSDQYHELQLPDPPDLTRVTSARAALEEIEAKDYNLVLTTPHFDDMVGEELAKEIVSRKPGLPVVTLIHDPVDAQSYSEHPELNGLLHPYLWSADPRLLLALVKSVEDRKNLEHDTREGSVRVILIVEDSPAFYSSYLPLIYTEVMAQTRFLMEERLNEREVLYRRRARPKIILARTYEEAEELFEKYQDYLLGIISDISFWKNGKISHQSGIDLVGKVRAQSPDMPILLQSANTDYRKLVDSLNVAFADKTSPDLLSELRQFMLSNFGFGPFVFRTPEGEEVDQADGMEEMAQVLKRVPGSSIRYHGERNHFSNWLMARSEFALSRAVRPVKVSDFATDEELRAYMVEEWSTFLDRRQRGEITEFARATNPLTRDFTRIGQGSMGERPVVARS